MNFFKKSLIILVVIFCGSAKAERNAVEGVVPFDISKAGSSAIVNVHVSFFSKKKSRSITLVINPPSNNWNDKYGKTRWDLFERHNKLIESITGKRWDDADNKQPIPHKGIRLNVTWIDKKRNLVIQDGCVLVDKINDRVMNGNGTGLAIDGMTLPPGDYFIKVKTLDDDSRFDGSFDIGLYVGFIIN